MPGFEEPGIREAWLCAAAHGNMAQVKAAFDAQHFDLDGFVPQSLEKVAAAAPKAKKVPAEKAKKPAAKKAAKASADDKSEPKKRGRPKKIVTESKPLPKRPRRPSPRRPWAPSARTPAAWSEAGSSHLRRREEVRPQRHSRPGRRRHRHRRLLRLPFVAPGVGERRPIHDTKTQLCEKTQLCARHEQEHSPRESL